MPCARWPAPSPSRPSPHRLAAINGTGQHQRAVGGRSRRHRCRMGALDAGRRRLGLRLCRRCQGAHACGHQKHTDPRTSQSHQWRRKRLPSPSVVTLLGLCKKAAGGDAEDNSAAHQDNCRPNRPICTKKRLALKYDRGLISFRPIILCNAATKPHIRR
jgi:hypothetical protein